MSILEGFQDESYAARRGTILGLHWRLDRSRAWYQVFALTATAVVLAGILVAALARPTFQEQASRSVFLTAVVYSAAAYGFAAAARRRSWALPSTAPSSLATSSPSSWTTADVLLLMLFLVVGAITSNLSGSLRGAAGSARRQAREARALFQLMREIAVAAEPADTFRAIVDQCDETFSCRAVLLAPYHSGNPITATTARSRTAALQVAYPPEAQLPEEELEAARWSFSRNMPSGRGTDQLPDLDAHLVPLETTDGMVAVLVFPGYSARNHDQSRFPPHRRVYVAHVGDCRRTLASQAGSRERARARAHRGPAFSAALGHQSRFRHAVGLHHRFGHEQPSSPMAAAIPADVTKELLTTIVGRGRAPGPVCEKPDADDPPSKSGVLVPRLIWADVEDMITTSM